MEAPAVIVNLPRYSDGEIDRAFMREIQTGYKLEREKKVEEQRLKLARKNAKRHVGKRHPVLGECVMSLPARDFFRLKQNYSHEEVTSDEFIRWMKKDPDLRDLLPNKI